MILIGTGLGGPLVVLPLNLGGFSLVSAMLARRDKSDGESRKS